MGAPNNLYYLPLQAQDTAQPAVRCDVGAEPRGAPAADKKAQGIIHLPGEEAVCRGATSSLC